MVEMLKKEFKSLIFKNDQLLQRGVKQMNKVRKSIEDLNEKVSNMDEKFNKKIEILRKN
jgi:TATA-box binding protein (TBP) (component of TFIID and TFIIIB)